MLKHTQRLVFRGQRKMSICLLCSSENREVVAGLWLLPESHLLVLACDHAAQEPLGLLAYALSAPAVGHASCVLLLAVFPQADLSDDALEQVLHVVVKGCWCLDELAVEHHCTGTSLCDRKNMERGELELWGGVCVWEAQIVAWVSVLEGIYIGP